MAISMRFFVTFQNLPSYRASSRNYRPIIKNDLTFYLFDRIVIETMGKYGKGYQRIMNRRVIKKQENSKMCLVCGLKNPYGLKAFFYQMDNDEIVAIFKPLEVHQGYPNRLHGGISAAILDETIGRAIMISHQEDYWGVTVEFTSRFKKPVPLGEEIRVVGRITKTSSRLFEGTGEILLKDGSVAVEGFGKYIKLPLSKIADFDAEEQEWRVVSSPNDPKELDL